MSVEFGYWSSDRPCVLKCCSFYALVREGEALVRSLLSARRPRHVVLLVIPHVYCKELEEDHFVAFLKHVLSCEQ